MMGSTFTEEGTEEQGSRFGWGTLVSVAALAVLVIGAIWALSPGAGVAPADDPVHPDVAVVESAIDAFNANDAAGLSEALDGADGVMGWLLGPPEMAAAKFAANGRIELDSCEPAEPGYVNCSLVETNDYWGAGGVTRPGEFTFRVADGVIIEVLDSAENQPAVEFGNDMLAWLGDTHPEVYASLPVYSGPSASAGAHPMSLSTSGVPIAEAMPTVLEYVDEFVAQSGDYPPDP